MGRYGICEINVEYKEGTTKEEKEKFVKDLESADIDIEIIDKREFEEFQIHADRMPTVEYRCEIFEDAARRHECIIEANGSLMTEVEGGVYFNRADEGAEEEKTEKRCDAPKTGEEGLIQPFEGEKDVYEMCPECETEVKLKAEFKVQTCPNCGKPIKPCAMCDMDKVDCSKCELNDE